jgi:hypothetical protein
VHLTSILFRAMHGHLHQKGRVYLLAYVGIVQGYRLQLMGATSSGVESFQGHACAGHEASPDIDIVVLPNSNRPPMRNNTRNTHTWKRYTMPIFSNVLSCRQRVDIAMVLTAISVQMALKCRCSGICSAKGASARFDIAHAFYHCGN